MQPNEPRHYGAESHGTPAPPPFTPPPSADGIVYEMRPDSKTFWRGVGTRALILLPLIALGMSNALAENGVGLGVILYVGLVVVVLAAAMIMLQTSRVVLTLATVEKHRLLLPPKRIARAAVTRGILVPQYVSSLNRLAPLLVLIDGQGRSLLKLTGQIFESGALFTLAERMGMGGFEVIDGPTGPKDVARRYPKVISIFERRPLLVVLLGTVVLLVLIVIGVSIFDRSSS